MARKLLVSMLILAGLGWIGVITYSYFFYNPGPQAPGALRREDRINEFVLKFKRGVFLDKNAELHFDEERPDLGFRAPDFELEDLNGLFIDEDGIIRGQWLGAMSVADMITAFEKTTRALDSQ